jgi:hypothetical protein
MITNKAYNATTTENSQNTGYVFTQCASKSAKEWSAVDNDTMESAQLSFAISKDRDSANVWSNGSAQNVFLCSIQ